jgi:hypothetical protein
MRLVAGVLTAFGSRTFLSISIGQFQEARKSSKKLEKARKKWKVKEEKKKWLMVSAEAPAF